MSRRSHPAEPRVAAPTVALLVALACLLALPAGAGAAPRLHAPPEAGARISAAGAEAARIRAYWTPARMRSAPPLLASGRSEPLALASFAPVTDATVPPYAVEGRIFIRQGRERGYCSGTAINSASRRLVLTAGHCVNTGPRGLGGSSAWSRYLEFVPAYTDGTAPFGTFVARRPEIYAPKPWVKEGNPNFDMGIALTKPESSGVNVADAVGGGATIALDRPRKQRLPDLRLPRQGAAAAALRLAGDRRRQADPPDPRPADGEHPLPLAARRQRRRLAGRKRDDDRRPDQLRPRPRRHPHLRPLLQLRKHRRPRRRPLNRLRR